jgi:hypothetical protein
VTRNLKGLLNALQQSINEAILESNDVAAAVAALKRTGRCPVFTIDVSMQDAPQPALESVEDPVDEPMDDLIPQPMVTSCTEELVLSDADVELLAALGISDPSWCPSTSTTSTA